jgi:hypothetical protein
MPAEVESGEPVIKLGEQLRELREEWGDGFDEDIAQPIAKWIKKVREQLAGQTADHECDIDRLEEQVEDLDRELEESRIRATQVERVLEDLADIGRGVRTVEEVLEKWGPVP